MKKENNRNKWLHIRLTDRELLNLKKDFNGTVHPSLSEYTRRRLLGKVIIGKYKDTRNQDLLKELAGMRRNLHGLATNYNQLAKKVNSATENEMESYRIQVRKLEGEIQKELVQLNQFIDEISEKWFQS